MCDYSLEKVASRPARVGDKLITSAFPNCVTHGFSAIGEPALAVCLLPGTEVAFEREVEFEAIFPFLPDRRIAATLARFRQIEQDIPGHRDALEFSNGKTVLLNKLIAGQRATVLQLPVSVGNPSKAENTTGTATPVEAP